MAKKGAKKKRLQIEYLIADPSFFTEKNGLRKLAKLEDQIAKYQLSNLSMSKIKTKVAATSGGTKTISSAGSSGGGSRGGLGSYDPELEKYRPTIVLPSVLRALDDLQDRKITVKQIFQDEELKEVFKGWGDFTKSSAFENRIKELQQDKVFIEFFATRKKLGKIKYATADEFKYDEQKIGTNSILQDFSVKVLRPVISNVIFPMLAIASKEKRAIIAHSTKFTKYVQQLGVTIIKNSTKKHPTRHVSLFIIDQSISSWQKTIAHNLNDLLGKELVDALMGDTAAIAVPYGRTIIVIGKKIFHLFKDKRQREKELAENDEECKELFNSVPEQGILMELLMPDL